MKHYPTHENIQIRVARMAKRIKDEHGPLVRLVPVPRGGIPVAYLLLSELPGSLIARKLLPQNPVDHRPTIVVDDIIDSGATRLRYPEYPFYALYDKATDAGLGWIVFPWEASEEVSIEDNVTRVLQYIGEDPTREGIVETPKRVIKSWGELYSGYQIDPVSCFKTFDVKYDELVLLQDIEFYSTCLAGSTFIDTPRGRIPIKRLKDGEFIYCWDEDSCKMTISKAVNPRITGRNKRLWRVYSDKDTILCTGDHKFLTHTRGWIKAKHLIPGDSIVALNKGTVTLNNQVRAKLVWTGMKKAISEHRFIFEIINGSLLGKHIHHINKKPNDNSPENLTALSSGEHVRLHRLTGGPTGFACFTDEQRLSMRKKQISGIKKSQTKEVKARRSASLKKYWGSLDTKQRAARNHRILLVEQTNWVEDVWCLDVPEHHNFVANGMVVHNCEHHMLPFIGQAHIAYIANGKVIGVSKLARLLEVFSRRLQIQERIGRQVVDALMVHLNPKGAACIIEAKHLCMSSRGVGKQRSVMKTSAMSGVFLEDSNKGIAARAELMSLLK